MFLPHVQLQRLAKSWMRLGVRGIMSEKEWNIEEFSVLVDLL